MLLSNRLVEVGRASCGGRASAAASSDSDDSAEPRVAAAGVDCDERRVAGFSVFSVELLIFSERLLAGRISASTGRSEGSRASSARTALAALSRSRLMSAFSSGSYDKQ